MLLSSKRTTNVLKTVENYQALPQRAKPEHNTKSIKAFLQTASRSLINGSIRALSVLCQPLIVTFAVALNTTAKAKTMHNTDDIPTSITRMASPLVKDYSTQVHFHDAQHASGQLKDRLLGKLIQSKIERKEFFYGIEIIPRPLATPLDYRQFGTLLPLFTSIVWLGPKYLDIENVHDTAAIRLGQHLQQRTVVVPHFSCYKLADERLGQFLSLPFANVLAVRGDPVDEKQQYRHAEQLVTAIRKQRKDSISIGVAGYPEGHPETTSLATDMEHLKQKINAGADYIITQLCFSANKIIQFIENCRANDIHVPIVVGLYIPETMDNLELFLKLSGAHLTDDDLQMYKQLPDGTREFREYAVRQASSMFSAIIAADLNVYGVQFYSSNRFEAIQMFLTNMKEANIFARP